LAVTVRIYGINKYDDDDESCCLVSLQVLERTAKRRRNVRYQEEKYRRSLTLHECQG
jgi:hypothetical protein